MTAARSLLAFLPPATLITALLYYFGWARTFQQAKSLGVEASLFDYTTTDYLLRSVDSLYLPLIALTGLGLLALLSHQWVHGQLADASPGQPTSLLNLLGTVLAVIGLVMLAVGLLYSATDALGRNRVVDILGPLSLGAGVLISAYGGWLRSRARGIVDVTTGGRASTPPWVAFVASGLLLAAASLSLFWAVGNYATWRGIDLAEEIAENYWSRPEVIVYSEDRLALDGVTEAETSGPDQIYRWRYSGIHLLDRVNGTYFLMPADWADAPRLILLGEHTGIRLEFLPGYSQ